MQELKDRILKDGQAIGDDIIKVDSFLNHQIDVTLLSAIGKEFRDRFADTDANKILTIEASGIAIACAAAWHMGGIPVVFAKKAAPNTMTDGYYFTEITSFTKRSVSRVIVSKKYLGPEDRVLIIDDFLAHGEAASGLAGLAKQSGAKICGFGAVIEKEFQGGGDKLRGLGYRVESLAVVSSIEDGKIKFSY
ncbi:MAG: xanthine phosphoribosyltransferase [Firmicutes bacterium HGW-Firmicutes-11]|jgi:xanthine phosphoribosyltransferase|nr:MAG: xanthine phosphoribosyltransferase [Firmicutes bacterium HGW-Firmicutes-11]